MLDFYLVVNSNDSLEYFQENQAGNFRVKLKEALFLQGSGWHVGLCEINGLLWDVDSDDTVYICCNICNGVLLPNGSEGLLRPMRISDDGEIHETFSYVMYSPLQTQFIDVIEIKLKVNSFITDLIIKEEEQQKSPNNVKAGTWCVLHFQQLG